MMFMPSSVVSGVAEANDLFRTQMLSDARHRVVVTPGVFDDSRFEEVLKRVREFAEFSTGNDPYGEHDFGRIEVQGREYFWKIDYYDENFEMGVDPLEDPEAVHRVMTIMRAEEY